MSGPNTFRPVLNPFLTKQIGKNKFPLIMTAREALSLGRSRNQLDTIDTSSSSSTIMPIKVDKPPSPPPTAEGMFKLDAVTGTLPIKGDQSWGYTLDKEMKEFYMLKAAVAKERYNAKLEVWRNGLSAVDRKNLKKVDPEVNKLIIARPSKSASLGIPSLDVSSDIYPDSNSDYLVDNVSPKFEEIEAEEQSEIKLSSQAPSTTELKKQVIASILETEELARQSPDANLADTEPRPASYLTYRHLLDGKVGKR
ncbi:hypothetical protein [Phaffia rhodozyma]|uniref:Uncharacterized protein n=1 Tax=Phaffia rhodozyma TaxID=264483 RepID=A0A0F7SNY4_PHARH|nr:hypothetical protein [Phaffia rhodozyma]